MKKNLYFKVIFVFALGFILNTKYLILNTALAQEMSSENYKLQGGSLDMTAGTTQNTEQNVSLADTVGVVNAEVFSSKGYLINPYLFLGEAASEFSLSLSSERIMYDGLDSGKASLGKLTIQVENRDNPGFNVFIIENQPLTDTGVGYRVDGATSVPDFDSISSFKPFPSQKRGQNSSLILSSVARKTKEEATLQINVSPPKSQAKGQYRNIIHIIGIPGI